MAFHPGYYISEIIESMGMTHAEFAMRMGTTGKTLSQLINGQTGLSNDLAEKLSAMLGNSIRFWLNLQQAYDEKVIEIRQAREIDRQVSVMQQIDYSYFVRVAGLPAVQKISEKIRNLCSYLKVSNLNTFSNPDFLVNFRTGGAAVKEKNRLNARIWLQTALNFAGEIRTQPFDAAKLKEKLPEIRSMTLKEPQVFLPHLHKIFTDCGVVFVLVPYLKNSGINGAVKWMNGKRVVLAMNDRMLNADIFWFSLFHKIRHVLQQKTKSVFIDSDTEEMKAMDHQVEEEADVFAANYLIPRAEYRRLASAKNISDAEIIAFAEKIGVHPGVVAGRLQHDRLIPAARCEEMKVKYVIVHSAG